MAKKYDIVETSKMSLEYDGSLLDVTGKAGAELQNGRLGVKGANGVVTYAGTATTSGVALIMNVERMGDTTKGLTDFCINEGQLVRLGGLRAGDEFKTTAFTTGLVVGDKVVNGANGTFVKVASFGSEAFQGTVTEVSTLGFYSPAFGFEAIPAISIKVSKAV